MNSKQRILASLNGQTQDHLPLTTWCFGLAVPPALRWQHDGQEMPFWYSMRMEHIHTLPFPWTLEDDFRRAQTWLSLGVDDLLDVSVPWSTGPEVTWQDDMIPGGVEDESPVAVRQYTTPSGPLRHAVRMTGEAPGPGWVIQPEQVPLFEDYNIPRALQHLVSQPQDIPPARHLYRPPDESARDWFAERMDKVARFATENGVAVQAWSAFGMDGLVWMTGVKNAIHLAIDEPRAFGDLVDAIAETDYSRTTLAAAHPGVDLVVLRGWYSSTDFWSPRLFDRFIFPHTKELADLAHRYGKKMAYVMTTGVEKLGRRLADAGVDLLYFVDPVQDRISLERARDLLAERMTLAGGTNALSLASGDPERIRREVHRAVEVLGPTNRFILHPVDAVFPDTPWVGIEALIAAWKETCYV
jgi:hypothetical protein